MTWWIVLSLVWSAQAQDPEAPPIPESPVETVEPVSAPAAPAPPPAPPAPPAPAAPPAPPMTPAWPAPACEGLRFATTREVEKKMKILQDQGMNRFLIVDARMVCGWRVE